MDKVVNRQESWFEVELLARAGLCAKPPTRSTIRAHLIYQQIKQIDLFISIRDTSGWQLCLNTLLSSICW